MTSVSVVIPVKDDPPIFAAVASALRAAAAAEADVEVIVVDNASAPAFAESLVRLPPLVHVIREAKPGPAAARNAGLAVAKGDVVFFTDADCVVESSWLSEGLRGLATTGADILQGSSRAVARTKVQRVTARRTHGDDGAAGVAVPASARYVDTKNLAVRRQVFDTVRFDESLLRYEDHAFGFAALAAGFRSEVWPAMRVEHEAEAHFEDVLAKAITGGWARRKVAAMTPGASGRALGRSRHRVRTAARSALVGFLGDHPRAAAWMARRVVPAGRLLERSAPGLPEWVLGVLLGVLEWEASVAGMALYRAGLAQPSVADARAGQFEAPQVVAP